MIGVVDKNLVFEFTDTEGLTEALNAYAQCTTILIVNANNVVVGTVNGNVLDHSGNLLSDDLMYYLYGVSNDSCLELSFGCTLPDNIDWKINNIPFFYRIQRTPKTIDY